VLAANPVLEYVVAVLPVLETIVDQVVPLSVDLSILYPVMADPPLFDGVVHDRLICDDETDVAVRPVGDCGAVVDVARLLCKTKIMCGE
jgi:hypothetical protein